MPGTAAFGSAVRLQRHEPARQTRRRWIDLFADYDARIEIVYIDRRCR